MPTHMKPIVQGIFVRQDKTFYYIETGENQTAGNFHLDKLMNILVTRNVVRIKTEAERDVTDLTPYQIISMKEAKAQEYKICPVYLSGHHKKMTEKKPDDKATLWKS